MTYTDYPDLWLSIAGERSGSSSRIEVRNPANGEVIGHCPVVTPEMLDRAVEAAHRAMGEWQDYGPQKRSDIIRRAAAHLRADKSAIAALMAFEQGKPLVEALAEVDRAAEIIEWDAEEGRRLYGRVIAGPAGQRRVIHRMPLGVVAGFSPWNAPLGSPARKISGPLAAGCGVVLKAAEEAPACAMRLLDAFEAAGVPKGLVNLVFGAPEQSSAHLIRHPLIRAITFTGSVPVGKTLAALCGAQMKPAVMELGGHAPVIIAEDADLALAARGLIATKSKNAGQICTSPTRVFIAKSKMAEFTAALIAEGGKLKVGAGLDPAVTMGPLATQRRLEAVTALVDEACTQGAKRIDLAPAPHGTGGYFMPLILLCDVPGSAKIMREEPFGPVILLNPVDSLEAAIEQANALPYGLAAYAFSRSDATLERLSDRLACGNLGLNCFLASTADSPLGGVKDSGMGREGGAEGVVSYSYVKNVVKAY